MTTTLMLNKRFTPEEALQYLQALLPVAQIEQYKDYTIVHYTDGSKHALVNAPIDWPVPQGPPSHPDQGSQDDEYRETVTKTVQVWDLDRQDRISLVNQAIEFAGVLNSRHFAESMSSIPKDFEYSQMETKTYESALKLLQREFDRGSSKTESHLVRSETEVTSD